MSLEIACEGDHILTTPSVAIITIHSDSPDAAQSCCAYHLRAFVDQWANESWEAARGAGLAPDGFEVRAIHLGR